MSPAKRIGLKPTHTKREIVVEWTVALILTGIPWIYLVWLLIEELVK